MSIFADLAFTYQGLDLLFDAMRKSGVNVEFGLLLNMSRQEDRAALRFLDGMCEFRAKRPSPRMLEAASPPRQSWDE